LTLFIIFYVNYNDKFLLELLLSEMCGWFLLRWRSPAKNLFRKTKSWSWQGSWHVRVLSRDRKRDSTGKAGGLLSTKDQKSDGRAGGENRGLRRINR